MAMTRRDLRRDIARSMHDLLTLTATTGSNNMLVDPVELTDYDGTFSGSQAVCISATNPENVGKVVRVIGNSQSGNSISFTPALPAPVVEGDVFDLHNLRGRGFRVQDYNESIRSAVKKHAVSAPRMVQSEPIPFDYSNSFIEIPDTWVAIYGVTAFNHGQAMDIHVGRYDTAAGWRVDPPRRCIEVSGDYVGFAHGGELVLYGFEIHPDVESDDDVVNLNPEFVALTVQSSLAQRRGDPTWNQWAAEWARMAAGARPGKQPSWPPNTHWLGQV